MPRISFTLAQGWLVQTSKSGWKVHGERESYENGFSSREVIFHTVIAEIPSTTLVDKRLLTVLLRLSLKYTLEVL